MLHKSKVVSLEYHVQFQETPDEIKKVKWEKAEHAKRDERQGQSKFRVEKIVKK